MPLGERPRGLDHAVDNRAPPKLVDRPDRQFPPITFALARSAVLLAEERDHLLAACPLRRDEHPHRLPGDFARPYREIRGSFDGNTGALPEGSCRGRSARTSVPPP